MLAFYPKQDTIELQYNWSEQGLEQEPNNEHLTVPQFEFTSF